MTTIVAIVSQKGGTGKTTLAVNLAGGLQKAGYAVGIVDLDKQLSARDWLPENIPFKVWTADQVAGQSLDQLPVDILLVDFPPGITDEDKTKDAARVWLAQADAVLVPLKASMADFRAAQKLVQYLARTKPDRTKVGVVMNFYRNTALGKQGPAKAVELFEPLPGTKVFKTTIGLREALAEVSGAYATIFDYAPSHEAAREFSALTREVIQWLSAAQV